MKVEFKDKEQSVTTEKNYDYTTWNVGDAVYYATNPDVYVGTGFIFHGYVGIYIILENQLSGAVTSVNTDIVKGGYTLTESKQKPKQDAVLTLEHDWEVALVTSLLGMLDDGTIDYLTNRDTPVHRLFEQFNNLSDYCANNDIHVNTDCHIRRQ